MKMQIDQQHALETNQILVSNLQQHITQCDDTERRKTALAKLALQSRTPAGRLVAQKNLREVRASNIKRENLRQPLANANAMLDAVQGAELTRQILESAKVTRLFTERYTVDPDAAARVMEAVTTAQERAVETAGILNEPLPSIGEDSYDEDAMLRELEEAMRMEEDTEQVTPHPIPVPSVLSSRQLAPVSTYKTRVSEVNTPTDGFEEPAYDGSDENEPLCAPTAHASDSEHYVPGL